MNELISKIDVNALEQAINKGISYGGEFFLRFQKYAIFINLTWLLLCIVGFILCLITINPLRKWVKEGVTLDSNDRPVLWFGWGVCFFFMVFFIAILSNGLIKAIYVPEVYLFQYITQ